jgi:hypothetical protein
MTTGYHQQQPETDDQNGPALAQFRILASIVAVGRMGNPPAV